jgi:hypothetical protein
MNVFSPVSTSAAPTPTLLAQTNPPPSSGGLQNPMIWQGSSLLLLLALGGTIVWFKRQLLKSQKDLKFQEFKSQELSKKLKLALHTIAKMETNPDLVHSREFNLDYLRMRMEEKNFNFAILNQIKAKIKNNLSVALRPTQADSGSVGMATTTGRHVSETIEVEYETDGRNSTKRVLFRIQVRLVRLPAQKTSETIQQVVDCMEAYLSPDAEEEFWQPIIQGHLATLQWDQKAKPTPLLVLEQTADGANVTLRSRMHNKTKAPTP